MMRATECLDEGLSIEDKIQMARGLNDSWGEELKREPDIHRLLRKLEGCLENSREVMLELGIVEACKLCDEEGGGSCCGAGLENKFDSLLLFINLLLGVSLPNFRCRAGSCYLLSERGCLLKVRLVLCVDYLCPGILSSLNRDELLKLQNISGDELVAGFMLYDVLKKVLRRKDLAKAMLHTKNMKTKAR